MEKPNKDNVRGWVGSILLHVILAVIFLLYEVNVSVGEPEFIEVSWGSISTVKTTTPPRASLPGSEGSTISANRPSQRSVDLPDRTFAGPDDILPVPVARKLDVEEKTANSRTRVADNSKGQKERSVGLGVGEKERVATPGSGDYSGDVTDPLASGMLGSDVGSSVSVSMQWSDGGTRRKISGDLPEYPEGVNVEAQIKIEAVVVPDGSVKSLKPAQKGNTRLEEAAMKAVRLWRFEPLRASVPQNDQVCVITFNFRLN